MRDDPPALMQTDGIKKNYYYPNEVNSIVEVLLVFTYNRFNSICSLAVPKLLRRKKRAAGITLYPYEQALSPDVIQLILSEYEV